ncbi:MAG TPA: hypothetical protein VF421_04675 [Niabella sp.]
MKKFIILAVLISGIATAQYGNAQVSVSVNIGSQPQWGPSGYNYARYYYLPEINAYYDVVNRSYIIQNRRSWVTVRRLPARYRSFDLYRTYKVVMNSNKPWVSNTTHVRNYSRYKSDYTQVSIRDYNKRNDVHANNRNDRNDRGRNNHSSGRAGSRR